MSIIHSGPLVTQQKRACARNDRPGASRRKRCLLSTEATGLGPQLYIPAEEAVLAPEDLAGQAAATLAVVAHPQRPPTVDTFDKAGRRSSRGNKYGVQKTKRQQRPGVPDPSNDNFAKRQLHHECEHEREH